MSTNSQGRFDRQRPPVESGPVWLRDRYSPTQSGRRLCPFALLVMLLPATASCGGDSSPPLSAPAVSSPASHKSNGSAVHVDTEERTRLPEAEREYLWQVEHDALLLKERGLSRIGDAIKHRDAKALEAILASDFVGRVFEHGHTVELREPFGPLTRSHADKTGGRQLGPRSFVQWLLRHREVFAKEPSVKTAIDLASPVSRDQINGLWSVRGFFRLAGVGQDGGPVEMVIEFLAELPRPTEELLAGGGWLSRLNIDGISDGRANHFLMREVAAAQGIDTAVLADNDACGQFDIRRFHRGGIYACDFNRDGCVDVLVTELPMGNKNVKFRVYFYQGLPDGRFEDVTEKVGLRGLDVFRPIVFADLNNDGWEDLVAGLGLVFANDEGKRFTYVGDRSNLIAGRNLAIECDAITVADYDRDGLLDLYVTQVTRSHHLRGSYLDGPTPDATGRLLRNRGGWQFDNVTTITGANGGPRSIFNAVWLDANNDGWPDLYVPHEFGNGVLLVNEESPLSGDRRFVEHPLRPGQDDFGTMGLTCGDIDNDGWIDLYQSNMYSKSGQRIMSNLAPDAYSPGVMKRLHSLVAGSQLYRNRGDLTFEPLGDTFHLRHVGWAWGACQADWNNDGWLDIYATCGFISRDRSKPDG